MIIQTPFKDCHGIQHTAPVVIISQATYSGNATIEMAVAPTSDSHVERRSNVTHSISYQAQIWLDAATKTAGLKPLFLRDKNGNEWHTIVLPGPLSDSSTIIGLCEQHILSTIIPQLTPAPQAQE